MEIFILHFKEQKVRGSDKSNVKLLSEYGYASSGESFSISDKNEAWIFEMTGKGPGNKGAVWVARLIPDGYVAHMLIKPAFRHSLSLAGKRTVLLSPQKNLAVSLTLPWNVYMHGM